MSHNWQFWLRWSWRDLRKQWLQVTVIALVIALGTGFSAGLSSTTPWRRIAADTSYERLRAHDLRLKLIGDSYVSADELMAVVQNTEHAAWIETAEPRLIMGTVVDASTEDQSIIVTGRIVGIDLADNGPHINQVHVYAGRPLSAADSGQNVVILEDHFADYYHLPSQGQIRISGGVALDYVGVGTSSENLVIVTDGGGMMAQANFAVVYAPLATVQSLSDHPGMANDLVLRLTSDADPAVIRQEWEEAFAATFPQTGSTLQELADDLVYQVVYSSIDMSQEFYSLITALFLAGAMFGSFNLATRMIEAQRREIGIGIALGTPPRLLALRPLLVGGQIAVLGAVLGMGIGVGISYLFNSWTVQIMPMPFVEEPFQSGIFLKSLILGMLLPFAATAYPVWRAVRVTPIAAIQTGHLVARGGGLLSRRARQSIPVSSTVRLPVNNLLRAPRRTLFTVLGIAMAITTLVFMSGCRDSIFTAIDQLEQEAKQDHPQRLNVALNAFYPIDSSIMTTITGLPLLSETDPVITLPGSLEKGNVKFDVQLQFVNIDSQQWSPTLKEGDTTGLILARKAMRDLGIKIGDTVTLEYPRREGIFAYRMVKSTVRVSGIHADPYRPAAYFDLSQAGLVNLAGFANGLSINPAAGVKSFEVKTALVQQPGVANVWSVDDGFRAVRDTMTQVMQFVTMMQFASVGLALLIAYNSTTINLGERAREVATMFAFGVPVRTVTRLVMIENLLAGLLGTIFGIGLGMLVLFWIFSSPMMDMLPQFQFPVLLSPVTAGLAMLVGVGVVSMTPLLAMRRLRRMDIPSTLRVME
jgi:putative ABC transport system permease protein